MDGRLVGNSFNIIAHPWISSLHESPEVKETSAMIKIVLGGQVATKNEDIWSTTVTEEVRLSAYPIALWLASSWWRLRWEPLPVSDNPTLSWRMAHELGAAGFGYVWPRLLFASDGRTMTVWSAQSDSNTKEPIRYLTTASSAMEAETFERESDEFISKVLARVDARKVQRTALHDLWEEIREERCDETTALERRLEAILGFDPDECPRDVLSFFKSGILSEAGPSGVDEIAPVCATGDPGSVIRTVVDISQGNGISGRIDESIRSEGVPAKSVNHVWEIGWSLARDVRAQLSLDGAPLTQETLLDLFHVRKTEFDHMPISRQRLPLGLAIKGDNARELELFPRKRSPATRRFELARFLGDCLVSSREDKWLAVTDARTARQKIQRAFAAEFLCPIEGLKSFLDDDFSTNAREEAADHFQVSLPVVEFQLVNNGELPHYYTVDRSGYVSRFLGSVGLGIDSDSTM